MANYSESKSFALALNPVRGAGVGLSHTDSGRQLIYDESYLSCIINHHSPMIARQPLRGAR